MTNLTKRQKHQLLGIGVVSATGGVLAATLLATKAIMRRLRSSSTPQANIARSKKEETTSEQQNQSFWQSISSALSSIKKTLGKTSLFAKADTAKIESSEHDLETLTTLLKTALQDNGPKVIKPETLEQLQGIITEYSSSQNQVKNTENPQKGENAGNPKKGENAGNPKKVKKAASPKKAENAEKVSQEDSLVRQYSEAEVDRRKAVSFMLRNPSYFWIDRKNKRKDVLKNLLSGPIDPNLLSYKVHKNSKQETCMTSDELQEYLSQFTSNKV